MQFAKLYESLKTSLTSAEKLFEDFIKTRKAGAAKIAKTSTAKGGYAVLTAIHFEAKEVPYQECIDHIDDIDFIEGKADKCWDKLKNWKDMSQREFQHVMGQLEAYGEVYIREKKPNSIKFNKN